MGMDQQPDLLKITTKGMILVWVLGTFSLVCSAWDNSGSLGPPHMVEVEYRYPGSREDYRDDCDPNPCENGGKCYSIRGRFLKCKCRSDYSGKLCEDLNDECSPNPCKHGGICYSSRGNPFHCKCKGDYTGKFCEDLNDGCNPNPCRNGGLCYSRKGQPTFCKCQGNYIGDFCETEQNDSDSDSDSDSDACNPNPCKNDGICFSQNDGTIFCKCKKGHKGKYCDQIGCEPYSVEACRAACKRAGYVDGGEGNYPLVSIIFNWHGCVARRYARDCTYGPGGTIAQMQAPTPNPAFLRPPGYESCP